MIHRTELTVPKAGWGLTVLSMVDGSGRMSGRRAVGWSRPWVQRPTVVAMSAALH